MVKGARPERQGTKVPRRVDLLSRLSDSSGMALLPNAFTKAAGIDHPIVQAPMVGATTPELVAAVSNAGALGSLAAPVMPPAAIIDNVKRIRALTSKPFNVNLFVLRAPQPTAAELARAQERLAPHRAALGLSPTATPATFCEDQEEQIAAVLELAPPVVSFAFDVHTRETVARFRRKGCLVIGTATNVAEARAWE